MSEKGERDDLDRTDMSELASGGEAALNRLMDRHGHRVLHFLTRILGDEQEAMDLTQETFVKVYLHAKRFRPHGKFSTWLYAIASNLARDRFRWRKRHPNISLSVFKKDDLNPSLEEIVEERPNPQEMASHSEEAQMVEKAIAELPEELRVPIVLSEYEGRRHAEIAEILGCSTKAVEMRVYRARKQLRSCLAKILKI
ncbi:MAG TPA: sigma-70 family RNA polymerase sigma factor [Verrucomicrobiales bacterium]|jgi:RNA polymerase sigma-70 factor (ECF subfamily)|nr:sigma-70 family RNA polymerase sigma factor [Verrucomicrobiales bacterium]HIL68994.1 sigma-70 family RNA polymerase sigma factor [Verrucomicrobiota bacterium]